MRVTVDNNIVISAFLWGGNSSRVLDSARSGSIILFTSQALIEELVGVLSRERFSRHLAAVESSVTEIVDQFKALSELIDAPDIEPVVIRDPDDDAVIACAVASQSDVIVSGDKDLLDLQLFGHIRIMKAAELLTELGL